MDHVGTEVRRLRIERGWTQPQLAVSAGIAVSGLSQIENGHRNASSRTMSKLAAGLGVEMADLFPKAEAPNESQDELDVWGHWYAVALAATAALPEDPDNPNILPDAIGAVIRLLSGDATRFRGLSCAPLMVAALDSAKDRLLGIVLEDELRQGLSEQAAEMQEALKQDA